MVDATSPQSRLVNSSNWNINSYKFGRLLGGLVHSASTLTKEHGPMRLLI